MPKLEVERSVLMEAPIEEIYGLVRDLKRWPEWSPWLAAERDAKLSFTDDGRSYAWDGEVVGSGQITVKTESANESLSLDLNIIKPWKSASVVHFSFERAYDHTRVTWRMDGSLPFFMFFLSSMMETMIGMDYERGLGMLKDLAETGSVPSSIELNPEASHPGCHYVGIERSCSMAEMPEFMVGDFAALKNYFCEKQIELAGPAFSIYSKWELSKGLVEYTACFPVSGTPTGLPEGFVLRELPPVNAYVVKHTGAYRHLGNAWSAGMHRGRQKVFKQSKKVYPFEVYVTEIDSVPEAEIVTEVYFPKA